MSDDFLKELKSSFLVEATDLLDQTEEKFIALEKNPKDKSILEAIFRCAHNLKGTGKAVGFDHLSGFAHKVENLLVKLKNGELEPSGKIIDLLLKCNDRFKENIGTLRRDVDASISNEDLANEIIIVLENKEEKHPEPSFQMEPQEYQKTQDKPYEDLGTILMNSGVVTKSDVEKAVKLQNSKLGEILVDQGKIDDKILNQALEEQKKQKEAAGVKTDEFIRIPLSKIDNILNNFGEQVILQSALDHAKVQIDSNKEMIVKTIGQLNKITYDLQRTAISLRMVSIKSIYSKMERIVRDTSKQLNKNIDFVKKGEETEIDKTIADSISDPLTHMIRNSVDHGIETPEERKSAGKNEIGTVTLNAFHKGGFLYIEVSDDGKGLDKDKLLKKAIKTGIAHEGQNLSDKQIYDFIFMSGFSVKEVATDISGRGVGMDVVKQAVLKLKGTCDITTKLGCGTTFSIKLPLTLAVFNGMIIKVLNDKYVIPNSDVEEIIKLNEDHLVKINPKERIIEIHGNVLPLVDLKEALRRSGLLTSKGTKEDNSHSLMLITKYNDKKFAIIVDEILTQQRIVHKNLGKELENLSGIAGGTILSDGNVALILELPQIINSWARSI